MNEATQNDRSFFLCDVNGVLLMPKPGQTAHLVTEQVLPPFYRNLKAVLSHTVSEELYISQIRQALAAVDCPYKERQSLYQSLTSWDFVQSGDVAISAPDSDNDIERRYAEYFKTYDLDLESVAKMTDLAKLTDITLVSGIPDAARVILQTDLTPVFPCLNPKFAALLNPHNRVSGSHVKMAAVGVLGHAGKPLNEHGDNQTRNVFVWEDDFVVAEWIAKFYNLRVYLRKSREEARRQSNLTLPAPNRFCSNGEIIFDATIDHITDDMTNPSFKNRPTLDYHY